MPPASTPQPQIAYTVDCQPGKYTETEGSVSCLNCGKGRYSNETGLSSLAQCKLCPAAKYSGALGAHSEALCVLCSGGRYGESEGEALSIES